MWTKACSMQRRKERAITSMRRTQAVGAFAITSIQAMCKWYHSLAIPQIHLSELWVRHYSSPNSKASRSSGICISIRALTWFISRRAASMYSSVIAFFGAIARRPCVPAHRASTGAAKSPVFARQRPQLPLAISPSNCVLVQRASPQKHNTRPCPPSKPSRFSGLSCLPSPSLSLTNHRPLSSLKPKAIPSSPFSSGTDFKPWSFTV
mmetsp:Transcript_33301/g.50345  ORF Transcript_33301/g.50345 Transcript_33301/m.50345 type:complete len:207 (+) Transcript_33301:84-704(+)